MTTPKLEKQMCLRRYAIGLSVEEISNVTGRNAFAIYKLLKRFNPEYTKTKNFSIKRKEAFLLYVKGKSTRELGAIYETHQSTIVRWFSLMHPKYESISKQGVFASFAEFHRSKQARRSPEQALSTENWLLENLESLIESEANTNIVSFSTKAENTLSKSETARYIDYRNKF